MALKAATVPFPGALQRNLESRAGGASSLHLLSKQLHTLKHRSATPDEAWCDAEASLQCYCSVGSQIPFIFRTSIATALFMLCRCFVQQRGVAILRLATFDTASLCNAVKPQNEALDSCFSNDILFGTD